MFKSPVRKLVKFFRKSRAAWRRKAESAERELRDMKQVGESLKNTAADAAA